jgi:hypothetical protein
MSCGTMMHVQCSRINTGKNYHRIGKTYDFGLLQPLIVDPKIYQNSLVKVRTPKIIRGLTKQ